MEEARDYIRANVGCYEFATCSSADYVACSSMDWRYEERRYMEALEKVGPMAYMRMPIGVNRPLGMLLCYEHCADDMLCYDAQPERPSQLNVCSAGRLAQCVKPCAHVLLRVRALYQQMVTQSGKRDEHNGRLDYNAMLAILYGGTWHGGLAPTGGGEALAQFMQSVGAIRHLLRKAVLCTQGYEERVDMVTFRLALARIQENCSEIICDRPPHPYANYAADWQLYVGAAGRTLFRSCPAPPHNDCSLPHLAQWVASLLAAERHDPDGYAQAVGDALSAWLTECAAHRHIPWTGGAVWSSLASGPWPGCLLAATGSPPAAPWKEFITLPCALIYASRLRRDIWGHNAPYIPDLLAKHCRRVVAVASTGCSRRELRERLGSGTWLTAGYVIHEYNQETGASPLRHTGPVCPRGI